MFRTMIVLLPVCTSVRQTIRPSVRLSNHPSVCLSVCLTIRLSVRPSNHLSVCPSIKLSVSLSVRPSIYLSIHLLLHLTPIRLAGLRPPLADLQLRVR